jgi:hypothetical protein
MKTKVCLLLAIFLWTSGMLYPGPSPQNKTEKEQKKEEPTRLLRKDLLTTSKKSFVPPVRNIFTRQRRATGGGEVYGEEDISTPGQNKQTAQQKSSAQQKPPVERVQTSVKYIGYVQSGTRVVALIILGGDSYAVETGDVLETGMSIGEITPDELEIFDRGPEAIRIKLEGEKP